jgi:hypothetical protein
MPAINQFNYQGAESASLGLIHFCSLEGIFFFYYSIENLAPLCTFFPLAVSVSS